MKNESKHQDPFINEEYDIEDAYVTNTSITLMGFNEIST